MIRAKKIRSLKPRVQIRKCGDVFHQVGRGDECEELDEIFEIFLSMIPDERVEDAKYLLSKDRYEDLYYLSLDVLGESVADWDLYEDGHIDFSARKTLGHRLFLDGIRSPYNVGSVFRSAEAFGVDRIYLRPGSASPEHDRARRTSRDTVDGIDWEFAELEDVAKDTPVFALELGGEEVGDFEFPENGICILGSEESGVSADALKIADSSLGRVSIRQLGAKGSINVSAAASILLYEWMKKTDN